MNTIYICSSESSEKPVYNSIFKVFDLFGQPYLQNTKTFLMWPHKKLLRSEEPLLTLTHTFIYS